MTNGISQQASRANAAFPGLTSALRADARRYDAIIHFVSTTMALKAEHPRLLTRTGKRVIRCKLARRFESFHTDRHVRSPSVRVILTIPPSADGRTNAKGVPASSGTSNRRFWLKNRPYRKTRELNRSIMTLCRANMSYRVATAQGCHESAKTSPACRRVRSSCSYCLSLR